MVMETYGYHCSGTDLIVDMWTQIFLYIQVVLGLVWFYLFGTFYKYSGNKAPVESWALYFHMNASGTRECKVSPSSHLQVHGPTTISTWEILATWLHISDQKAGVRGCPDWHSFAVRHTRGTLLPYSNI